MKAAKHRILHKHFRLDAAKIRRARQMLNARTETETIERALDAVIAEHTRNEMVRKANERFFKSGLDIADVFGKLAE